MPVLSIITINLNNAPGLEKTIKSVINQSFKDFEFIIIDGGSNDRSVEIIKQYEDKIIYWISEKDNGIYNAMNKGIQKAKGKYCQFLNSGDWLVDNKVLEEVFSKTVKEDIIYGNRIEVFHDKEVINKGYHTSQLSFKHAFQGCILHTCSFSKRELFERFGFFDEDFQIVSDYVFFLKTIGLGNASVKYLDITISYFDMSGISKNQKYHRLHSEEIVRAKSIYLPERLNADYELFLMYDRLFNRLKNTAWSWFLFRCLNKCSLFCQKYFKSKN